MEECKTPPLIYAKLLIPFEVVTSTYLRRNIILFLSTLLTSLSTVFKRTLVYPFFPRLLTWRTILGSASWLLYWFMPMSDKTASLLQIMESQNVTISIAGLPDGREVYLSVLLEVRFVTFTWEFADEIWRNLKGIIKYDNDPCSRSTIHVPSSKYPLKY